MHFANISGSGMAKLVLLLILAATMVEAKLDAQGKYQLSTNTFDERGVSGDSFKMMLRGGDFFGDKAVASDTPVKRTCASCRCGTRKEASRVVGGQPALVNEFPWMARLSNYKDFSCGGSLISDVYVLTAAHCAVGNIWYMMKVTFGELDQCDELARPLTRFVLYAIVHDMYNSTTFDNDIALLRLDYPVPISDSIRPICLPTDPAKTYDGTIAIASGWGKLSENGNTSCTLQKVEVPVLSKEVCNGPETGFPPSRLTDNMMCAGYPAVGQRDTCFGDSGGPLAAERPADKRFEEIGIVSYGYGCALPKFPKVYTRVTQYLEWIKEKTKDGCSCTE